MKQICEHEGKIVLIDWVDTNLPPIEFRTLLTASIGSAIPTIKQDRSTWLELSEKCGGKLEEGVHYTLHRDKYSIGLVTDIAIPTPQEDLWEEAFTKCSKELYKCSKELYIDLNQVSMFIQVKEWFEKQQEFSLTRKS